MDVKDLNSWGLTEVIARVIEDGFFFFLETGEVFFTGDELNKLEEALDNKLNGLCGYIKKTESQVEMLKSRKNDIESNIKFYENRVLIMDPANGKRIVDMFDFTNMWTGYLMIFEKVRPIVVMHGENKLKNVIIKYGRFIPNEKSHWDEILQVNLASSNQFAEEL